MGASARLNLLLTPPPREACAAGESWHQTLRRLLLPLGVQTFEAATGPQAVELIEKHPIHLAVVDSRLPTLGGLDVLRLVQKLHEQRPAPPMTLHWQVHVEQRQGHTERRIEVRFDSRQADPRPGPVIILIAPPPPQQDPQLLQEALTFNAFSVLSEPVDVNLMLDVMARAMKRFHQNQWPA